MLPSGSWGARSTSAATGPAGRHPNRSRCCDRQSPGKEPTCRWSPPPGVRRSTPRTACGIRSSWTTTVSGGSTTRQPASSPWVSSDSRSRPSVEIVPSDRKILITGLTGQIGHPVARYLARDNEVWGVARYSADGSRERAEAIGVHPHVADLETGDYGDLPTDFTHLVHFAAWQGPTPDFDRA
ncbi:MAG TPA: NAD-dependent epimerase/dehydratase family protein, partial [Acidimicrobiia bacterium]|nr:NAD-dependent epimerase/dehydratase family protein [Acidimicrobiia bacterium]